MATDEDNRIIPSSEDMINPETTGAQGKVPIMRNNIVTPMPDEDDNRIIDELPANENIVESINPM